MIEQKQLENVEYFNYLGSMIINDARWTREIKSRTATVKAAFTKKKKKKKKKKKSLFDIKLHLNLRKELVKFFIWSRALYGAENRTLRKLEQKSLESYEM